MQLVKQPRIFLLRVKAVQTHKFRVRGVMSPLYYLIKRKMIERINYSFQFRV